MADQQSHAEKVRKEKVKEKGPPPYVSAANEGDMGQTVEGVVAKLREHNPDKEYRYVYAPEHKSDYNQLMKRHAQGYTKVDAEKEGVDLPHGQGGTLIRVGDVLLMEIPKEKKEKRQRELNERAAEDARRAKEVFEESVRGTSAKGVSATPVGDITREQREYSVETEE